MTDQEIRDTIRQMLADWESFTPEQRAEALRSVADQAAAEVARYDALLAKDNARRDAEALDIIRDWRKGRISARRRDGMLARLGFVPK